MSEFVLSCCTTADLSAAKLKERGIPYLCYHYVLGDMQYVDDLGKTKSMHEFYQAMRDGAMTKTSQVAVGEYYDYFKSFLSQGKDLLHLTLSSGITGSYSSALTAKKMLDEEFPDRKLYVMDSLAASSGYGLLMDKLADLRDEGKDIEELKSFVEEHRLDVNHWVFSTTLEYFVRGGRISKTAGFFGNMLGICPIIHVNADGKLIPGEKAMGVKVAQKRLLSKMEKLAENGIDYSQKCFISHSDVPEEANSLAKLIEEKFPHLNGKVEVYDIGTTIGAHTGPGTVALFFWGAKRVDHSK